MALQAVSEISSIAFLISLLERSGIWNSFWGFGRWTLRTQLQLGSISLPNLRPGIRVWGQHTWIFFSTGIVSSIITNFFCNGIDGGTWAFRSYHYHRWKHHRTLIFIPNHSSQSWNFCILSLFSVLYHSTLSFFTLSYSILSYLCFWNKLWLRKSIFWHQVLPKCQIFLRTCQQITILAQTFLEKTENKFWYKRVKLTWKSS